MDEKAIKEKILSSTCSVFEVTDEEIKSITKLRRVVDARKAIVYFMRAHFKSNVKVVAAIINKDPSVIGYMLKGAMNLMVHDVEFKWNVERIKASIGLEANCPCCGKPY